jgi:hypothetical protein
MATPTATYSGDFSTLFETRLTTRVTDKARTKEGLQALNNPTAWTGARQWRLTPPTRRRARVPQRASRTPT